MARNRMTSEQIMAALSGIRGAKVIGLTTITEPRMRKTGNPFVGNVGKVSRYSAMVNFNYDAGVLRRLEKEGKSPDDFKRGESWHIPVLTEDGKLTPFCKHKTTGEVYLRVMYRNGKSRFIDNHGRFVSRKDIEPFLQESGGYKNQGLEDPLIFLTLKLSSVKSLTGV